MTPSFLTHAVACRVPFMASVRNFASGRKVEGFSLKFLLEMRFQ